VILLGMISRTGKEDMISSPSDRKLVNIFLQLTVITTIAAAQPANAIELKQSLKPSEVAFEQSAVFEITISWDGPQSRYFFPHPLRPQFERLTAGELASSISSTGEGDNEVTTKKYRYTLSPALSGLGRIEPITIDYISWPDSIPGQLVTEPMTITIAQPKPPTPLDKSSGSLIWIIVIVVAAVLSGGAYYLFVIKPKQQAPVAVSPEQELLRQLELVQAEAGTDIKRFQTGLYKLLMEYLNRAYGLPTGLNNAAEVAESLKKTTMTPSEREIITGWLTRAEREKFTPSAVDPGATTRLSAEVKEYFETK